MTIAPERPLALPAPPAATGPQLSTELAPVAAPYLPVIPVTAGPSPRPHYIAAAIATGVELTDLLLWLLLRPLPDSAELALLLVATLAGSALVGAAAFLRPQRGNR